MKRTLLGLVTLVVLASSVRADVFGDFKGRATTANIKPFALDVGGVLGAAGAPTGKSLGFPGFSVGVVGGAQFRPDRNDDIMRGSNVKTFGVPLVEAAVGLPAHIDLVGHGMRVGAASIYGGGVRWGVVQAGTLTAFLPSLNLAAFYDGANETVFGLTHFGASAGATWTLIPIVHPFANVGFDSTRVKVKDARVASAIDAKVTANGYRAAAGVELTPLPLFKIRAAYAMLHGLPGAELGVLFQF